MFSLRGISAFPAGDRAAAVEARLETVARDRTFDPQKLAVVEAETMSAVMAGKLRLVSFVDADGELEGVSRRSLAGFTCNRIRQAIIKYRADRHPEAIQNDVLTALLYTGILAIALLLLAWVWRRIMRRLATRIEERVRSLGVDSLKTGSAQRVGSIIRRGLRSVFTLIILVAVYLYAHSVLGLLPWTRSIHAKLGVWVIQPRQIMGNSVINQIPNLIFLLILFFVLRWVLGLVRLFFDSVAKGTITLVGIGYETPWRQVEAMLLQAADRTPDLLKTPPPFVLLNSLGDFCVVSEINAFCDQPQQMGPLYARLHRSILDVFNEYGVQIMTPAYEGDPDQPKVVPRDEWYKSPAEPPRE